MENNLYPHVFRETCLPYLLYVTPSSNAMPSPLEKGDRGAVDKDYPGMPTKCRNWKMRLSIVSHSKSAFHLFPHLPFTTGIGPIRSLRDHLPHWGRLFHVSRETRHQPNHLLQKSPFLRKGQARLRAGDRSTKKSC